MRIASILALWYPLIIILDNEQMNHLNNWNYVDVRFRISHMYKVRQSMTTQSRCKWIMNIDSLKKSFVFESTIK